MKLITALLLTAICFSATAQNISIKDGIASVDDVPYCKISEPGRTGPAAKLAKKLMGNSEFDVLLLDGTLLLSLKLEGNQMVQYFQCMVLPLSESVMLQGDLTPNKLVYQLYKYKAIDEQGKVHEQGLRNFLTANTYQPVQAPTATATPAVISVQPNATIMQQIMATADFKILYQGREVGSYTIIEQARADQWYQTIRLQPVQGVVSAEGTGPKMGNGLFRMSTAVDFQLYDVYMASPLDIYKVQTLAAIMIQLGYWR